MKVFLDTNIIIDFYAKREEFFRPAALIIDLAVRKEIEIFVSATTFVNAFYILRKKYDKQSLYNSMRSLATISNIAPVEQEIIRRALQDEWNDFEDCVQFHSAENITADVIVTRNVADFSESSITVPPQ